MAAPPGNSPLRPSVTPPAGSPAPGHDDGPGDHQGLSSSNSRRTKDNSPQGHQQPGAPAVYPEVRLIAGRDRQRLELVVTRCPRCGQSHAHRAATSFLEGLRTSPCGQRYLVVAGLSLRGAA